MSVGEAVGVALLPEGRMYCGKRPKKPVVSGQSMELGRREFPVMGSAAVAAQVLGAEGVRRPLALGFDNYAVRAMGWKAGALIDCAGKLKGDSLSAPWDYLGTAASGLIFTDMLSGRMARALSPPLVVPVFSLPLR